MEIINAIAYLISVYAIIMHIKYKLTHSKCEYCGCQKDCK